ncbi:antirestriction protein ArdA [Actinotignum sp. GS-2025b]|uniref:antirestriction protein ArdA n=1 Tax=Actinotignum sp. GS-2025b TaxID=3427275 RepID=UPI003F481B3F
MSHPIVVNVPVVVRPSAWVGCLACYNAGVLRGVWAYAEDAGAVTPEDIHEWETDHEELWCFDTEGLPCDVGEIPPSVAQEWGELFEEVGEPLWPALVAWFESGSPSLDTHGLPSASEFEDSYRGEWDSFEDFAWDYVENSGLLEGVPEEVARYFDIDAYQRDLRFDYTLMDVVGGSGVYVFAH